MSFPSNLSAWSPVILAGAVIGDPTGDISPAPTDIVGSAAFPASYFAYDGTNIYFRLRLNGDPRFKSGFQNFAWGVLIDTDGVPSTYEWVLAVNGNNNQLDLIANTVKIPNNFNDQAEGTDGSGRPNFSQPIVNFDIARASVAEDGSSFGGGSNYFLDFLIPASVLFANLGINANSRLRFLFFTSTNSNNYNKDNILSSTLTLSGAFSDPTTPNESDVRAKLSVMQTVEPPAVSTGAPTTFSGTITVRNEGRGEATTVFARTPFAVDNIASFRVTSNSIGTFAFSATQKTLTWNIGNLAAGATAELTYELQGTYVTSGTRPFDTVTVTGADRTTGSTLTPVTASATVTVNGQGSLSGTVLDKSTGLPIVGIAVQAYALPAGTLAGSTASGAGGLFSIGSLPPGQYRLDLSGPGYQPVSINATVISDQTTAVNVLLQPTPAVVQGNVTASGTGTPIIGATVRITNAAGADIASVVTDANGFYAVGTLPPGTYRVSVAASGYQLVNLPVTLAAGETRVLNAALSPSPSTVAGVVSSTAGAPIAGATVDVLDNRANLIVSTTAGPDGSFLIDSLAPATNNRLRVSAPGFETIILGFQTTPGQTTTVNPLLSPLSGEIVGTVTDGENGGPLAEASIRVFNAEGLAIRTATSAADGSFAIPSLSPGSYTLVVTDEGYAQRSISAIVTPGGTATVFVALLRLAGAIEGTVLDENGLPLADATVRIFSNNIVVSRVFTDENGHYLVPNLAAGNYLVSVRLNNYGGQNLGAYVEPGQTTAVSFRLSLLSGTVSGTVVDADTGVPIPGALIAIQLNENGGGILLVRVIADSEGRYIANALHPGSYMISVTAGGYQNQFAGVEITPDATTEQSFSLQGSPGAIHGVVRDIAGAPILGATVTVRVTSASGAVVQSLFTDTEGRYEAANLAAGTYSLFITAVGYQTAILTVAVQRGETTDTSSVLAPSPGSVAGRISSSVTLAGIAAALVTASDQNGFIIASVLTDSDGSYRIDNLTPGSYTIQAVAPAFQSRQFGAIVIPEGVTPVDFGLDPEPAFIEGIVVPAVPGTIVQLFDTNNIQVATTVAQDNGNFRFSYLREGNFYAVADVPGYSSDIVGVSLRAGQTEQISVTLTANPGSVSGFVRDPAGQPIPYATIRVSNGNETVRGVGQADADGSFVIANLPPVSLLVVATAPAFGQQQLGISISPGEDVTDLNFVLQPNPGGITGQVTDRATGNPLPGAEIEVRTSSASGAVIASVSSSPFGNFLIEGLTPGDYVVIARSPGYSTRSVGALVQSDITVSASIALTPVTGAIAGSIIDPSGQPINGNGTEIKLLTPEGLLVETVFAMGDGQFRLADLAPGPYVLVISSPGYRSLSQGVNVVSAEEVSVALTLIPRTATLTGRITQAGSGNALSGVQVTVSDVHGIPLATGHSDETGAFVLAGLIADNLIVTATAPGFGAASAGVITVLDETVDVTLELLPNPGSVFGLVSDFADGSNVPGAIIRLFDSATGSFLASTVSDPSGAYAFDELAPGQYEARAFADGFAGEFGGFTIVSGQATRYSFALSRLLGRLTGTVTDLFGRPLASSVVTIHPYDNYGPELASALTDANGRYDLGALAPANYVLVASRSGYLAAQTSALVNVGETTIVDFVLPAQSNPVDGTIIDAEGNPIPNAPIVIIDENGVIIGGGVSNPGGVILVPGMPELPQTVIVTPPGLPQVTDFIQPRPGQPTTIDLVASGPSGAVSGQVLDDAVGQTVPGAIVHVLDPENNNVIDTVITDNTGNFRIDGLVPGDYTVTVTAPEYGSSARSVAVGADRLAEGSLALSATFGLLRGTIRDEKGRPLAQALAEIVTAERLLVRAIISDAAGRYALSNLPAGTLYARFSFPGKETALLRPVIRNGETTVLDVVLTDEDEE